MASPPDRQHSKRDSGQSSDTNSPPSTAAGATQAPAPGHSPVMGYPPTSGYPPPQGYAPPYQGYPNGYNQYPYAQAPPAAYYGAQQYPPNQPVYRPSAFLRGVLAAMILLIVLLCVSSIITWLVLRPQIPEFQVTAFSVSNFNVSGTTLIANWEVSGSANNPNTKLKVYLDQIHSFIYHLDGEDHVLSTGLVAPFFLETKGQMTFKANMSTGAADQPLVASWVLDNMRKERNTGTVVFSFRMLMFSTYKTGGWWTRHLTMKVFCEQLKVTFLGAANNGAMAAGKPVECAVYV